MSDKQPEPIATYMNSEGVPTASTVASPQTTTQGVRCAVPPHTVVPVVFVPGIMGSNLKSKNGVSTWNANSKLGLAKQWGGANAEQRYKRLAPEKNTVDSTGAFGGPSATVPDKETAVARHWDRCSQAFYGDFLHWLDNELNGDLYDVNVAGQSPWYEWVGDKGPGDRLNAEASFEPITEDESIKAWNDFFCPVHVAAYNWLQSNKQSGKDVADRIHEVIQYWNDFEKHDHKPFKCEKVILVTHSMGGLTARAAVHPQMGGAADEVLGIVHGELPANGAAAAYHHCRSGYSGISGSVLGDNAAEVTAVFANAQGAMELLPNQQYTLEDGDKAWLKARTAAHNTDSLLTKPASNPYAEIYNQKEFWWRLIDSQLIDPTKKDSRKTSAAWQRYLTVLGDTKNFHQTLATFYHPQTYAHYGADADTHPAYGELVWQTTRNWVDVQPDGSRKTRAGAIPRNSIDLSRQEVTTAKALWESNPVLAKAAGKPPVSFTIVTPDQERQPQPGDGTVPACSGSAPFKQGGGAIKQSFRLSGFEHSDAYNHLNVRHATFYSIGKLLQQAEEL